MISQSQVRVRVRAHARYFFWTLVAGLDALPGDWSGSSLCGEDSRLCARICPFGTSGWMPIFIFSTTVDRILMPSAPLTYVCALLESLNSNSIKKQFVSLDLDRLARYPTHHSKHPKAKNPEPLINIVSRGPANRRRSVCLSMSI